MFEEVQNNDEMPVDELDNEEIYGQDDNQEPSQNGNDPATNLANGTTANVQA